MIEACVSLLAKSMGYCRGMYEHENQTTRGEMRERQREREACIKGTDKKQEMQ